MSERKDIPVADQWRLEDIYLTDAEWENALRAAEKLANDFGRFEGTLDKPESLLECMKHDSAMLEIASSVFAYARMRRDEDNRVSANQALTVRAQALLTKVETSASFLTPELLSLPAEYLREVCEKPEFAEFAVTLREIERQRPHTLSKAEERIVAMAGEMAAAPDTIYTMLADADMKFPVIKDEKGEDVRITHANYIPLMMNRERKVRAAAFEGLYTTYKRFSSTIPALYDASVRADIFSARTAKHKSALEAALFPDQVSVSVYDNLVSAVRRHIPSLARFVKRNGKLIGVDDMRMIDLYVPAVEGIDIKLPFDQAYDLVTDALSVLGEDYQDILRTARRERWIDVYENEGKSAGAYSWGTYGTHPYVLLNYKENLDSVLTIAHEMGHSAHTYLSNKRQPYLDAEYSLFVAEVASTTNEILVLRSLMERYKGDRQAQAFLTWHLLDGFRGTVFRQTMFAEFEREAHAMAERGEALTADSLNAVYAGLNAAYYPQVHQDPLIAYEWMRIPHFYNAFYVYKYATGFSAAMALAEGILQEGESAVARYKEFLSLGSSVPPLEALRVAGVDMERPEAVDRALDAFDALVDKYEELTK